MKATLILLTVLAFSCENVIGKQFRDKVNSPHIAAVSVYVTDISPPPYLLIMDFTVDSTHSYYVEKEYHTRNILFKFETGGRLDHFTVDSATVLYKGGQAQDSKWSLRIVNTKIASRLIVSNFTATRVSMWYKRWDQF